MFHESDTAVPQKVLTASHCVCQISASFLITYLFTSSLKIMVLPRVGKSVRICSQTNFNSCSGELRYFKSPAKYNKVKCFGWCVYYQEDDYFKVSGAFYFWLCYFCNRRMSY